jgi:3-isopropylmalate/(R)-2-methylmalate dehydratase small subunit
MEPIRTFTSKVVPLLRDSIDTDQIIPARFLKGTQRTGLGEQLFNDWRADPTFPLIQPQMQGRSILLAGSNFGCGSSREHAPWALTGWGFRAVIALSFADIFRLNSLKNALLPIVVSAQAHAQLCAALAEKPEAEVVVDLASATLRLPSGKSVSFPIDPFAQKMLLAGTDELGYLLSFSEKIATYESRVEVA